MTGSGYLPERGHPQYKLRKFYIQSTAHLFVEAVIAFAWTVEMVVINLVLSTGDGAAYRIANVTMLFHLGVPIAMGGILQQVRNNNSVLWWTFFIFFMGLAGDIQTIIELSKHVPRHISNWAWNVLMVQASINLVSTTVGIAIYTYWFVLARPKGIPQAAAFTMEDDGPMGYTPKKEDPKRALLSRDR